MGEGLDYLRSLLPLPKRCNMLMDKGHGLHGHLGVRGGSQRAEEYNLIELDVMDEREQSAG